MPRTLSPEEVAELGLEEKLQAQQQGGTRQLTDEEARAMGIPGAARAMPTTSEVGAFARGARQGATAGFADELGAAFQAGLGSIANALPEGSLEWAGIDNSHQQDTGDIYREARAGNRAQLAADRDKHAWASGLGEMAGGIALNALVPGGLGLTGTRAAAQAAALGAASGLGESEADLTKGEVGGAVWDTAKGAGLGFAGQVFGEELGRAAPKLFRYLQEKGEKFAAMKALNAAGYFKNELKPILKRDNGMAKAIEMGQNLLDEPGVLKAGAGVDSVLEGVEAARERWGQRMGEILQQADSSGAVFDMSGVARRVIDDVIKPNVGDPAIEKEIGAVASLLQKYLKKAQQPGGLTFSEANKLKSTLMNGQINWGNHWNNYGPSQFLEKYQVAMAGIFADEIDNQLGRQLGPEAFEAFKLAKSKAGTFIDATAKAKNLNAALEGNNSVNLKDLGVGAVAGGGIPGFVATLASKLGRERGASVMARVADRLSSSELLERLATTSPEVFGEFSGPVAAAAARGPEALAALAKVLGDTSPEWRQMREEQERNAR